MNLSAFRTGATLSISTGMILILFSFLGGKEDLFLLLNHDLGSSADFFFKYFTHAGDGIFWVPVALYFIFYKRKLLPLVLSAIILSTLLVQTGKKIIYPNEARPTAAIESTLQNPIHTVKGVTVHSNNSFPSGHTTTAFSLFLLGCLLLPYTYFWLIGFTAALLAGYSRIYLAQHFPLDVGGGIICAYITVFLSLQIQNLFNERWNK
ncbi:phosphatase PAP2 family protein [Sediminibacterium sp.]|uniref:phosphatase PAP2 family protein n=1 Tax=Sediminibacterium sp. TaxID=1917865 RepID=UPI0027303210|nr:phosphatase PAP2 family protein [Sediminibacterium sp.]MDP2421520.1 phosphatase PAP2 family protein [Sediminibacterium sp.]